jgi:outer membrane protein TolC
MRQTIILSLIFVTVSIQAQTLEEYLEIAATNNPALKSSFLEYQAALEKVPQVGTLPDPEVGFGYFISPVQTRVGAQEASISAKQMFPWFGTLGTNKEVQTEKAKARFEMFEQEKKNLFFEVRSTYYLLYQLEESIRINELNLEILRTFESLATTKYETGRTGLVDVFRIQLEIAELENSLLSLHDKKRPLTARFNGHLNLELGTIPIVPDTIEALELDMSTGAYKDSILVANNSLQSIGHSQQASLASVEAARLSGAPSIGIGLNYIFISERTDVEVAGNGKDAFLPMLTLKMPIYRGKYKAKVRESKLNEQALNVKEEDLKNTILVSLETGFADYDDAQRRVRLFQNQQELAQRALDILVESYGTDASDFEEILRVQRMLLTYQLELIKAVVDQNIAVAALDRLK